MSPEGTKEKLGPIITPDCDYWMLLIMTIHRAHIRPDACASHLHPLSPRSRLILSSNNIWWSLLPVCLVTSGQVSLDQLLWLSTLHKNSMTLASQVRLVTTYPVSFSVCASQLHVGCYGSRPQYSPHKIKKLGFSVRKEDKWSTKGQWNSTWCLYYCYM